MRRPLQHSILLLAVDNMAPNPQYRIADFQLKQPLPL